MRHILRCCSVLIFSSSNNANRNRQDGQIKLCGVWTFGMEMYHWFGGSKEVFVVVLIYLSRFLENKNSVKCRIAIFVFFFYDTLKFITYFYKMNNNSKWKIYGIGKEKYPLKV